MVVALAALTALARTVNGRPAWVPIPLIPAKIFEQAYYRALHKNVAFAIGHVGLTPPLRIELGILGLRNVHLAVDGDDIRGPIQPDESFVRTELASADPAAIDAILLEFFNEVYDKTGYARPVGLHGFPPEPQPSS